MISFDARFLKYMMEKKQRFELKTHKLFIGCSSHPLMLVSQVLMLLSTFLLYIKSLSVAFILFYNSGIPGIYSELISKLS